MSTTVTVSGLNNLRDAICEQMQRTQFEMDSQIFGMVNDDSYYVNCRCHIPLTVEAFEVLPDGTKRPIEAMLTR